MVLTIFRYDSSNQVVIVKAVVKKPRHFFLNTLEIDFGVCMIKGFILLLLFFVVDRSKMKSI
jgi:hypothetical protein